MKDAAHKIKFYEGPIHESLAVYCLNIGLTAIYILSSLTRKAFPGSLFCDLAPQIWQTASNRKHQHA